LFDAQTIRQLLADVASGARGVDDAMDRLRHLPFEAGGVATLDHHRALRKGFCEVVFCQPKTPDQVAEIFQRLAAKHAQVLGTRATPEQFAAAQLRVPDLQYHETARAIWLDRQPDRPRLDGVVIITAGTADLPVAEEAAVTLDLMGHAAMRLTDVGVAGLHRLLPHVQALQAANVIIVVAGMEGALPSVVGGLVSVPVIGVPTSVGYGTSFGGVTPLLAMLNSCASGLAVVNIDNGFGAAHMAAAINRLAWKNTG
jgi:NCAIR mutase (PurE)-related protein